MAVEGSIDAANSSITNVGYLKSDAIHLKQSASLINRGYNVEKVISYKRKKEIIEKEDADIIIFQKKILPGHKISR